VDGHAGQLGACQSEKDTVELAIVKYKAFLSPLFVTCLVAQVFIQDPEVPGRYKLVAERLSRPGAARK
jgi:hypothetical protein